jgi:hypothetical protein
MLKLSRPLAVAGCLLLLSIGSSACASLMAHTSGRSAPPQDIDITSTPEGAEVLVDGKRAGVTPLHVALDRRRKEVTLHFEKNGYAPADVVLHRTVTKWVIGNVALAAAVSPFYPWSARERLGGAAYLVGLGMLSDFMSRSAFIFPSQVAATLTPAAEPPAPQH